MHHAKVNSMFLSRYTWWICPSSPSFRGLRDMQKKLQ